MKKIIYIGGGSLLLLLALICGAVFATPLLASAHGVSTNPSTTTTTNYKHPDRHELRVFVHDRADEFVDRIAPQLHLTPAELTARLKSGEHLKDIAKDQGVSIDSLKTILINATDASIALALHNGKITQQQATTLTNYVKDHPFVVAHVLHRYYYWHK